MSSPLLSDSPSTFKVDCNVAGAFLENRPKFKFLQNSSDFFFFFFFFHLLLYTGYYITAQVGFYIIPLSLGQGPQRWLQKEARTENKMEEKIQLQASRGLWFDAILIYAHMVSMNMINLTTECNLLI